MTQIMILIVLTLLFSTETFPQLPVHTDSLYIFIKSNSIHRTSVDWQKTDSAFQNCVKSATSPDDTMNCFVRVLEALNDVHSQIWLNNKVYGNYPRFDDTSLAILTPLTKKSEQMTNVISCYELPDSIPLIRVPSFILSDFSQVGHFAKALYDSIIYYGSKKVRGFIIDLRLNGGGNLYPMLSGLSPLFGNCIVGYETDPFGQIIRKWEIKDGNFIIGGYKTTDLPPADMSFLEKIPVAVITGPVTRSSGSLTAVAFKGRENTVFIGEPTADGYTTSNGFFQFTPSLFLNFATTYVADRNLTIYKSAVDPDIFIYAGDDFENLSHDLKIRKAAEWILSR